MSETKEFIRRQDEFREKSGLNNLNSLTAKNAIAIQASTEEIGIIYSVLQVDKTVYAIAIKGDTANYDISCSNGFDGIEIFGCYGNIHAFSPHELYFPISNIDLSILTIDPRTLIGGRVMVSLLDGYPVKMEYVGQVDGLDDTPLYLARNVFRSLRNYVGAYKRLDSDDADVKAARDKFGIDKEVAKKLYSLDIHDLKGNVLRFEGDAVYTNDVLQPKEGEIIVKPIENLTRLVNEKAMKTKRCHLPVKIFSAR